MNTFQARYQAPQLRASDADRDAVVATLSENYQAGRLTTEELEDRTGKALAARTFGDLQALTADLPGPVASAPQPGPVPPTPGATPRYGGPSRRLWFLVPVVLIGLAILRTGLLVGSGHAGFWIIIPIALIALRLGLLGRRSRRRRF
jgi:Domain of unknown function (DUF1707)